MIIRWRQKYLRQNAQTVQQKPLNHAQIVGQCRRRAECSSRLTRQKIYRRSIVTGLVLPLTRLDPLAKGCRSWAAPGAARPNPSPGRTGCKRVAGATGQRSIRSTDRRNRFGLLRRWRPTPAGFLFSDIHIIMSIWKSLEKILEK